MQLIEYVKTETKLDTFEANGIIMAGKVYINNEKCTYGKQVINADDIITIKHDEKKYVTRSGLKLEKALSTFQIDVNNLVCIDIGASEGGFTDCLLRNNAQRVYSVDVAYGILNWKLRTNEKVVVLERTNARYLDEEKVKEKCDLITSDVSFISITKILPNIKNLLKEDGIIITLFKPQFELPKELVKKNGNIEKPEHIYDKLNETIIFLKEHGIYIRDISSSPIRGNNGNIEFLLLGDINSEIPTIIDPDVVKEVVEKEFL